MLRTFALAPAVATTLAAAAAATAIGAAPARATPTGPDLPTAQDPHPPALNTATCNYHGTLSPLDATYAAFESGLVGPRGNTRSIQEQVELHQVGGVSVAIIEGGVVTQHHWYGCRDRKRGSRTTANTLYQAASMSKFIAAAGIVIADRLGDADLDQDVAELAEDYPDSLLAEWVDDQFRRDSADYPEDITLRRLLSHTAGLDTHGINAWSPTAADGVPTMREILLGSNDFGGAFAGGVEPVGSPGTSYLYSGGGFTVAELALDLQVPASFASYVDDHLLDVAGMTRSTLATATSTMPDLVRGCSRSSCSYDVMQTNVKAAGGLLANVREYAELVTALGNGGVTGSGRRVFEASDLNALLAPASAWNASLAACTTPGATRTTYINLLGRRVPYAVETCVGGKWRVPLADGDAWYGLGLSLSTSLAPDGWPRKVSHGGSQTGSKTKFELDRQSGDGFVIMVNGVDEWVDGDGYVFGASALLEEIHQAYHAAY